MQINPGISVLSCFKETVKTKNSNEKLIQKDRKSKLTCESYKNRKEETKIISKFLYLKENSRRNGRKTIRITGIQCTDGD